MKNLPDKNMKWYSQFVMMALLLSSCGGKGNRQEAEPASLGEVVHTVGTSDTLGMSLRTERTVYSTRYKHINVTLSNHSGTDISHGEGYWYAAQDADGVWRRVPSALAFFAVEHLLNDGGEYCFSAYVERNVPGRYRLFFDVWRGNAEYTLMTEFCLSDEEK